LKNKSFLTAIKFIGYKTKKTKIEIRKIVLIWNKEWTMYLIKTPWHLRKECVWRRSAWGKLLILSHIDFIFWRLAYIFANMGFGDECSVCKWNRKRHQFWLKKNTYLSPFLIHLCCIIWGSHYPHHFENLIIEFW